MKLFETTKVADGVYSFRFAFHRNMFVVTDEGVIATDPMNPKAAAILMKEIRKVTDKPIKYVVYSHNHWDHVRGGRVFKEAGARFISHAGCVKHFKRDPNPALVMPDETFKERYDLNLGGKTLELLYFGRNHSDCLVVMRLPEEKILFIVDLVTPRRLPYRILPDYFPKDWIRSLREIEKLDFDRIIPGHGIPVGPASAVRETREFLEDLMAAVKEARKKTRNPDKIREMVKLPKYEKWGGYNQSLAQNVERINLYYHMGW
ncbi:MAG: MBL fold metallo-hydrolase [Nitrospinota bacterium]